MHRAIIVGTGFSGLAVAIQLKKAGIHDFVMLEKAEELGGTWRENTYPGAECDIPSALYSYSFEPSPKWEYKWSHQPQILAYMRHCAQKYELYPHVRFGTEMTGADFDEDQGYWAVHTQAGEAYRGQSLIVAVGQLHHPRMPDIPGRETFEGPAWHSAQWDHSVEMAGKEVGVIGNAASAVQFIPQVAKAAKNLRVFQRSANWMLPKQDRAYHEWEKELARRFPFLLKVYRYQLWLKGGALFSLMGQNRLFKKLAEKQCVNFIKKSIEDPALQQKLIPDYPIGAKRVLFSDDYYPALNRDNVEVITDSIQEITPRGILLQSGREVALDALVYGTGFVSNPFLMNLEVNGLGGKSIREAWANGAEAYLGITTPDFPNFFMMYGPNTNLGHNSIIIMSECQAGYITQCIQTLKNQDLIYMNLKPEVQHAYTQEMQERLARSAWVEVKNSWYKSGDKITNNWPGRTMEYAARTRRVDHNAYELVPKRNLSLAHQYQED